jgi:hypothetical protein
LALAAQCGFSADSGRTAALPELRVGARNGTLRPSRYIHKKPEGQMTEVSYMFPKPGADKTPVPKVTFVTRVGDLGCGVGYYK